MQFYGKLLKVFGENSGEIRGIGGNWGELGGIDPNIG